MVWRQKKAGVLAEDDLFFCSSSFAVAGGVHLSCMATKTITLELDAYEKLRRAKKSGESFSEVVRRASFGTLPLTGEVLRAYLQSGGSGVPDTYLDSVEEAAKRDSLPSDPWA